MRGRREQLPDARAGIRGSGGVDALFTTSFATETSDQFAGFDVERGARYFLPFVKATPTEGVALLFFAGAGLLEGDNIGHARHHTLAVVTGDRGVRSSPGCFFDMRSPRVRINPDRRWIRNPGALRRCSRNGTVRADSSEDAPSMAEQSDNRPREDVIVSIRGLRFARGSRVIFDGVDLDIPRGKITAIMGPSGTGKTTLLRLIGGQLKPASGSVQVDGQEVAALSHSRLYAMRQRMGMLFQSGALLTDLNVFDNVAFPLREHSDLPESMIRDIVLMKLEAVGLRGAHQLGPNELSGGMARRVALARAIALDPMMIMYDEPFAGQDPISMGVLVKLIKLLNDAMGLTSIVVTHDVPEATSIADYVYLVSEGKVVEHGTPEQLGRSRSEWVRQFLNGEPDGPVPFHYPAPDYLADLMAGNG